MAVWVGMIKETKKEKGKRKRNQSYLLIWLYDKLTFCSFSNDLNPATAVSTRIIWFLRKLIDFKLGICENIGGVAVFGCGCIRVALKQWWWCLEYQAW
jgi:hypothetical protein